MDKAYVVKVGVFGKAVKEPFDEKNSYKQLSDAVGGMIESAIIPEVKATGNYEVDCFVNEEGLLKQLPLNVRLTQFAINVYGGPLVGNAIFVGHDDMGETVGLNDADADAILAIFN